MAAMFYPTWLLPAAWVSAAAAVACAVARPYSRAVRRRSIDLAIFLLLATALSLGGTAGLLFNRRAPHLSAEGIVYDVETTGAGSGAPRQFKIFTRPESTEPFELRWNDPHIRNGQLARVTWQAASHRLLVVEVLYGDEQGYVVRQKDGIPGAIVCLVGAVLLAAFGIVRFLVQWERRATSASGMVTNGTPGAVDGDSGLRLSTPDL